MNHKASNLNDLKGVRANGVYYLKTLFNQHCSLAAVWIPNYEICLNILVEETHTKLASSKSHQSNFGFSIESNDALVACHWGEADFELNKTKQLIGLELQSLDSEKIYKFVANCFTNLYKLIRFWIITYDSETADIGRVLDHNLKDVILFKLQALNFKEFEGS